MSMKDAILQEWDQEMAGTRKTLERIPDGQHEWAPHTKSMKLGKLGAHVATMGMWAQLACDTDVYDAATGAGLPVATSTAELVAIHDDWASKGRAAIVAMEEDKFSSNWTLRVGDREIFSRPRSVVMRSFVMNHMIHHRAQLTVYLRLLEVKVPGLYGPTADDA